MTLRIATIVGARPQFVKAGAISRVIAGDQNLSEVLIHTGQHYDDSMSDIFFRELEISSPAYNLGVQANSQGAMTGRMLEGVEAALKEINPALVIVYGDTNSTLAGALAASKLHIPIAHVEAGLRSFNRRMPEEINRVLTDHLASLHLCPTRQSVNNLAREGITAGVYHCGDVMYDATLFAAEKSDASSLITDLDLDSGSFAICTIHRAENTDDPAQLQTIFDFLDAAAADQRIIAPTHPRTRRALTEFGIEPERVEIIEPLGYFDLHALLGRASMVFTDSGGLQKESYFHGKPCVTLRNETEWTETVDHGWNRLWTQADFAKPRTSIPDYGDGHAARRIVEIVHQFATSL